MLANWSLNARLIYRLVEKKETIKGTLFNQMLSIWFHYMWQCSAGMKMEFQARMSLTEGWEFYFVCLWKRCTIHDGTVKKCQFIFIQNVNDYLHLHVKTCIWASASLPWKVHWVILLLTYVFSLSIINSNTWSTDSFSAALETVYTAYDSALISPENKKIDCESILCDLPYKRAGLSHVVMVCQVMSFKVATCKSLFCCWLQSMCIT